jgi:hypothetical protein
MDAFFFSGTRHLLTLSQKYPIFGEKILDPFPEILGVPHIFFHNLFI